MHSSHTGLEASRGDPIKAVSSVTARNKKAGKSCPPSL